MPEFRVIHAVVGSASLVLTGRPMYPCKQRCMHGHAPTERTGLPAIGTRGGWRRCALDRRFGSDCTIDAASSPRLRDCRPLGSQSTVGRARRPGISKYMVPSRTAGSFRAALVPRRLHTALASTIFTFAYSKACAVDPSLMVPFIPLARGHPRQGTENETAAPIISHLATPAGSRRCREYDQNLTSCVAATHDLYALTQPVSLPYSSNTAACRK